MSITDVLDVKPMPMGERQRELDVRLMQVMDSLDRTRGYRQRWRAVARAARPAQEGKGSAVTAGQAAPLDGAAA